MRCVVAQDKKVVVAERPRPDPTADEILVSVSAAGLNGADISQVAGNYPAPAGSPPDILGLELAGIVEAIGANVRRFARGDRLMSLVGGGGQAEWAVVHERIALPVPGGIDLAEAAGFCEVYTTAHDALFTQAGLAMGQRVLIHGATGGVGVAAVQLAVAAGADVTAVVRTPSSREQVEALGPRVTDPSRFVADGPYDVILETVGGSNIEGDVRALAVGGRLVVIGTSAGGTSATVDFRELMAKRARIFASTLRSRPLEERALAAREIERHVLPLFAAKRVTVPVCVQFPLAEAPAAYERFAAGGKFGKVILSMKR